MSLSRLKKTDFIVLAGDFNLPDWNRKDNYVKTSCQHPCLHEKFVNIINDAGPTNLRFTNTTRQHTRSRLHKHSIQSQPYGNSDPLSDHGIPLVEMDIRPIRRTQKPRKIHLYKRADWDDMETEMKELNSKIQAEMNKKNS